MKVYKLRTPYLCLVKNEAEETVLSPNETLEIEGKILVYPIGNSNGQLPFILDCNHLSPCSNYLALENEGMIFLSEKGLCENYSISKLNINGENCTFEVGENKVTLLYKTYKKVITLPARFDTYKTGYKNNIAYIHFKGNSHLLYAMNIKNGKLKMFAGKEIEIIASGFIVKNDTENEYKITAEGLTGSIQTNLHLPTCDESTAYCFLQALKYNDIDYAYSLLSTSLKETLSKQDLKDYFGAISSFHSLTPFKYAVKADIFTTYSFTVHDCHISDIEN